MKIVLIPGWNEGADGMRVFVHGRRGRPGLCSCGFECFTFDGGKGSLTERIHQLAQFINGIQAADSSEEPLTLFGYSAGGVIARGYMRLYPDVAVASIFQLGVPNAGIVTDNVSGLLRRLHFSRGVVEELDIESEFMTWLNGTSGHWETDATTRTKHWILDRSPWIVPPKVPIFNLVGRMPRYENLSDGVVIVDSATLNGRVPHEFIEGNEANHLNLSGNWNAFTLLLRRWRSDNTVWPLAVDRAARFFEAPIQSGSWRPTG